MMTTTTDNNDAIMVDDIGMGMEMDVDTDRNIAENSTTAAAAASKLQNNDHDVINVDDLLDKFGLIHTDAKLIAGKPTIVFFGGTGAGKVRATHLSVWQLRNHVVMILWYSRYILSFVNL